MEQEEPLHHCGKRDPKYLGQDWEKCYDEAEGSGSCCLLFKDEVPCEVL